MLDRKRAEVLTKFTELLTRSAEPTYFGTVGVEVKVQAGDILFAAFPQTPVVKFEKVNGTTSTPRI